MIFKPFRGGQATVEYQMANPTAKVLRGNPRQTSRLIQASRFSQPYCAMTLSFEETISTADETRILDEFTALIRGGLEADALDILVVRHTDKKHPQTGKVRHDYHITVVETELRTGKKIVIYHGFKDHDAFYAWERMVNIRHGFSRPDDPARRHTMHIPKRLGQDRKAVLAAIDKAVTAEVSAGRIRDRFDVMEFLERANFKITRHGKNYLSIQDEDEVTIRLRGLFYESTFDSSQLAKGPTGTGAGPDSRPPETLADVEKRFRKQFVGRVKRFRKFYRTGANRIKAAALGNVRDDSFVRVDDLVFDPNRRAINPQVERPGSVDAGEPKGIGRNAGIESDTSRCPGQSAGRPDADRSQTHPRINYEESTIRTVQDFLGKAGRVERRARQANAIIDGRARSATATTGAIFRAAATAMGAEGQRIIYASSGFRDTLAGVVEVLETFDHAARIARNPIGYLAQFLIQRILVKQQERELARPRIKPPRIS
jgi:hypothetical protein